MRIAGMQKLTLLDFPGVVACVIFTSSCNFRCPFCHNASLVNCRDEEKLEESEILKFLEQRKGILEGVVITGGEPLINLDIAPFLREIKKIGYKIKIDTNGTNPKLLKQLVEEKLIDYVAMDIKNSPEQYIKAVGTDKIDISSVTESKNFLLKGSIDYEFRTTLVKGIHNLEEMKALGKWIKGAKNYYLQQFKDSGDLLCADGLSSFSDAETEEFLNIIKPYVELAKIRGK